MRGNPPGVPAANRVETAALSLTDRDLWGGNFVSQIFFNRSRDAFGGEIAPIATFQDPAIAPSARCSTSRRTAAASGAKFSYERALPGFDDLTLTIGFDALTDKTEQALIATGRVWVPPSDFRSLAPFGQANLKLFEAWSGWRAGCAGKMSDQGRRLSHARVDDFPCLFGDGHDQLRPRNLWRRRGRRRHTALRRPAGQRRRHRQALGGHPCLCELCRGFHRTRYRPHHPRGEPAGDRYRHLSTSRRWCRTIARSGSRSSAARWTRARPISGHRATRASC